MVAIWKSSVRSGALLCAAVLATSVLGACGSEQDDDRASEPSSAESSSSESPSESPTESPTDTETPSEPSTDPANGLPVCADVWVDGLDLPKDYTACSEDGTAVKPETKMCGFGSPMIIHDDRYYALRGNRVNDVGDIATSEQFQTALAACQA